MEAAVPLPLNPLVTLLDLSHRARHAGSVQELRFMAVNDCHELAAYRQGALWFAGDGVASLSGVMQIEANVPYVLWLDAACRYLAQTTKIAQPCAAVGLPEALGAEWGEWLPAHGLWLPIVAANIAAPCNGGLLLAREQPWTEPEIDLLREWLDTWRHAWQGLHRPPSWSWRRLRDAGRRLWQSPPDRKWWQTAQARWLCGALLVALFPVRLSVLAPGELVPANPAVVRAPLDGIIDTFQVQPNQAVKKDQPLFEFDQALIRTKLEVARQALATAETEYRQAAQQALTDSKSKAQLAVLTGKIEEKRAEALFLADQLDRAQVVAPQDGVALLDDPSEWIGRPVAVGERIMRIAAPGDVEVEAWVPLADAIPLPPNATVSLHLAASPLAPVAATLRYQAHDAVERPDGSFAYRVRARLDGTTGHRIGLKGTTRLNGDRVPLIYWVLRRPLASIRSALGW